MSIEIPITGESTSPQKLRSAAAYATQVRRDWEHKSFEHFFEAGRKSHEQLDRRSAARPSLAEVASRNSEFEGAEAARQITVASAEDGFELSSKFEKTISSPSLGIDRAIDSGPALEGAVHVPSHSGDADDGYASLVGENWRAETSLTKAMASGTGSRAAAAVPATSALVVKLTKKAATVSLRDAHLDTADIYRLRYAIASELGWTGLSLASFKVNGEEFQSFERQATSAPADGRRQPSGKTLFRISDGETE